MSCPLDYLSDYLSEIGKVLSGLRSDGSLMDRNLYCEAKSAATCMLGLSAGERLAEIGLSDLAWFRKPLEAPFDQP